MYMLQTPREVVMQPGKVQGGLVYVVGSVRRACDNNSEQLSRRGRREGSS